MSINRIRDWRLWSWIGSTLGLVLLALNWFVDLRLLRGDKQNETDWVEAVPAEIDCFSNGERKNREVVVSLINRGGHDVNVLEIATSCGCTLPSMLPSLILKRGKAVQLKIAVDLPPYGKRESVVTIRTDSSVTPRLKVLLHLHGQKLTPPYMSFAPSEIRIASIIGAERAARDFKVICVEANGDPWLEGFDAVVEGATVKAPRMVKETNLSENTLQREYESELAFTGLPADERDLSFWLTPRTRTETTRPFPLIKVIFSQLSAVRAVPASVVLSFSDIETQIVSRQIALIGADDEKWEITSLKSDVPWLTLEPTQETAGRTRRVLIKGSMPPFEQSLLQQSTIRIGTSHPQCPEVIIQVTAVRRSNTTISP